MARPERFELPTNWFEASYSIQLSYGRIIFEAIEKIITSLESYVTLLLGINEVNRES